MAFVAEDLVRFAQGVTFAIVVSVFVVDAVGLVTTLHRLECNLEARASRRASSSGPPTTSSPSKWCGWGGNGGTTLYDIHQSIPHERISFLGERSASSPQRYSTRSSVQQVAVGTRSTGTAGASFGRRGEPAGGHSKPDIKGQSRPLLSPQEKCAEEASMLLTLPFELDATTTLAMYEAGRTKTRVAATGGGRGSLAESGESGSRAETRALSHLRASDSRCNISSNANGEHVHTMVEVTEDFSDGDDFEETLQDLLKHLGGPVCLLLYLFFGAMDSDGVLLSVTSLAA
eukprot:gene325-126_t